MMVSGTGGKGSEGGVVGEVTSTVHIEGLLREPRYLVVGEKREREVSGRVTMVLVIIGTVANRNT
jgi:hypothetical protein